MKEKVEKIRKSFEVDIELIKSQKALSDARIEYLGKEGKVTELSKMMKTIPNEDKKEFGMLVNELRNFVTTTLDSLKEEFDLKELNERLENERIDITLPGTSIPTGSPNILEKTVEDLEELLMSMGYDVVEGPEIEEDLYNFELLNLPKGHPARDSQDTFYIEGDKVLLRSHTSPVQARTMLEKGGKEPIRIVCPGKAYRRDDDDATHSHQFMQMEGLLIDKKVSLADLKGTFDVIAKHLFGENSETRFRPSYYPFTEPSVEMDVSCFKCGGKGCAVCKNTGWITIGGAGVVNPHVLEMCGYDPKVWHGFAFGFGLDRIAMVKYEINDIRAIYNTDLREAKEFDRGDK